MKLLKSSDSLQQESVTYSKFSFSPEQSYWHKYGSIHQQAKNFFVFKETFLFKQNDLSLNLSFTGNVQPIHMKHNMKAKSSGQNYGIWNGGILQFHEIGQG